MNDKCLPRDLLIEIKTTPQSRRYKNSGDIINIKWTRSVIDSKPIPEFTQRGHACINCLICSLLRKSMNDD